MPNIIEGLGSSIGGFAWGSMGQIVFWVTTITGVIVLFIGIWFFMWWKSFNLDVKIYEPIGLIQLSEKEKQEIAKGKRDILKEKNLKFDMIRYHKTHGKYSTIKGSPFFRTFMPLKKHEPIPMEFMFNDGIHMIRLSKDVFIPIPRPKTEIEIGENITISIKKNNRWRLWNNMMAERINRKYQDMDAQKKMVLYFVVGIVAIVVVGCVILWFIYSSANKGWDAAEKFNAVANSLVGGNKPA